jgi:hypothetical protein
LFAALSAFTQTHQNDSAVNAYHKYRSEFIDNKTQLLGLSVFTRNRDNQIAVEGTQRLTYYPNDVTAIGVRIQHKWLGLAVTYSPQFLQPEEKGKTKEIDLHVYVYGRKHNVDAYYMNYKGFYIDNYRKIETLRNAYKEYPLLPEMTMEGSGINYFYVFNHKRYSLRSTYLHNEVQKKSAGSFLLGASSSYLNFSNPTSILPNELDSSSNDNEKLINGTFYVASILPGYAHTFVLKRFYFTLAPMIGLSFQYQDFNVESQEHTKSRFSLSARSIARLGLGYNAEKFFAGITAVTDSYNYQLSREVRLQMRVSDVRLILGYRFAPKGIVKKASDKMDLVPITL